MITDIKLRENRSKIKQLLHVPMEQYLSLDVPTGFGLTMRIAQVVTKLRTEYPRSRIMWIAPPIMVKSNIERLKVPIKTEVSRFEVDDLTKNGGLMVCSINKAQGVQKHGSSRDVVFYHECYPGIGRKVLPSLVLYTSSHLFADLITTELDNAGLSGFIKIRSNKHPW